MSLCEITWNRYFWIIDTFINWQKLSLISRWQDKEVAMAVSFHSHSVLLKWFFKKDKYWSLFKFNNLTPKPFQIQDILITLLHNRHTTDPKMVDYTIWYMHVVWTILSLRKVITIQIYMLWFIYQVICFFTLKMMHLSFE